MYGSSSASSMLLDVYFRLTTIRVDLVHAVAYSLLLLNTDLHVADLTSRMSRSQFVRNTLAAIQMQLQPSTSPKASSPDVYDESGSLRNFPLPGSDQSSNSSSVAVSEGSELDTITRSKRSDSITSWNSISRDTILSSPALSLATSQATTPIVENDCTPNISDLQSSTTSMASSNIVYGRAWEANMENLLKVLWFHALNRIITDFFIGNVQRYQESANTPAFECQQDFNVFFTKSRRANAEEPQPTRTS